MYSPAAPLWKENFPYLHLANRYNLRKPEIALLWSGRNNRLAPGGNAFPIVLDLGRGDLQPLGYSYAYIDEPGLHASGGRIQSPVGLRHLGDVPADRGGHPQVRGAGRHVRRPAGDRTPHAHRARRLADPVADGLQGQGSAADGRLRLDPQRPAAVHQTRRPELRERGRSIDYSGYNLADKCLALEPVAPGTQAWRATGTGPSPSGCGRWARAGSSCSAARSGATPTTGRACGGRSAAQEDVPAGPADRAGRPAGRARRHATPSGATATSPDNGTEEYLLLFNPSETAPQTVTTDLAHGSTRVAQIFDPKTGRPVAGADRRQHHSPDGHACSRWRR